MHTTALPDWANSLQQYRHVDLWCTNLVNHECVSRSLSIDDHPPSNPNPSSSRLLPQPESELSKLRFHWTNVLANDPSPATATSNALQIVSYYYFPDTPIITSMVAPLITVRGDEDVCSSSSYFSRTNNDKEEEEVTNTDTRTRSTSPSSSTLIPSRITAVSLSKSLHRLWIGTDTGQVRCWTVQEHHNGSSSRSSIRRNIHGPYQITETYKYTGHVSDITSLHWFPSDQVGLSTSIDYSIKVWDATTTTTTPTTSTVASLSAEASSSTLLPRTSAVTLRGHTGGVLCAKPLKKGSLIITGSRDGTLRIWRLSSSSCIQTIVIGTPIYHIEILTTENRTEPEHTASSSSPFTHYTSTINEEITATETELLDSTLVLIGGADNTLRIVSLSTDYDTHLYDDDITNNTNIILPNPVRYELTIIPIRCILALNFVPDDQRIIIGSNEGNVFVYRMESKENRIQLTLEWEGKVGEGYQTADVVCMKSFSIVPYVNLGSSSTLARSSSTSNRDSLSTLRIVLGLGDSICGIYGVSSTVPYPIQLVQFTNPLSYGIRDIDIGIGLGLMEEGDTTERAKDSNLRASPSTVVRMRVITGSNDGYVRIYDLPYQVIVHMLNVHLPYPKLVM